MCNWAELRKKIHLLWHFHEKIFVPCKNDRFLKYSIENPRELQKWLNISVKLTAMCSTAPKIPRSYKQYSKMESVNTLYKLFLFCILICISDTCKQTLFSYRFSLCICQLKMVKYFTKRHYFFLHKQKGSDSSLERLSTYKPTFLPIKFCNWWAKLFCLLCWLATCSFCFPQSNRKNIRIKTEDVAQEMTEMSGGCVQNEICVETNLSTFWKLTV